MFPSAMAGSSEIGLQDLLAADPSFFRIDAVWMDFGRMCRTRRTFSVCSTLSELQEIAESTSDEKASSKSWEAGCSPFPAAEVH